MKKICLTLIISLFILSGCAEKKFEPFRPNPIKFEKTPEYKLDTKPLDDKTIEVVNNIRSEIKYGYFNSVTGKIEIINDKSKATYIMLTPEAYAKLADLLQITSDYRSLVKKQESLINDYVANINELKNISELERQISQRYCDEWATSENLYREERRLHKRDNTIDKIEFIGSNMVWGLILIGVLAL